MPVVLEQYAHSRKVSQAQGILWASRGPKTLLLCGYVKHAKDPFLCREGPAARLSSLVANVFCVQLSGF
jgi:hypothetical protein